MTAATVTVVCDLFDGSGAAITHGTAWFAPSVTLTDAADGMFVPQAPVPAEFRSRVSPTVGLLPTDDPSVLPSGWAWGVQFAYIAGNPAAYNFFLPAGPASFTAAAGTPCTLGWGTTAALTSLPNGSGVRLSGGSVPAAFSTAATYYVVDSSGTTVSLATSRGGSAIASASPGSGALTVAQYNLSALSPAGTAVTISPYAQLGGGLSGMPAQVVKIQGTAIAAPTGIAAEYLNAQGNWTAPPGTDVISVFGRTGAVVAEGGDYTAAQVGALPSSGPVPGSLVGLAPSGDATGATDKANIQALLNIAGRSILQAGHFYINGALTLHSGDTLAGAGAGSTDTSDYVTLIQQLSTTANGIQGTDVDTLTFSGFALKGPGSGSGIGMSLTWSAFTNTPYTDFANLLVAGFGSHGIAINTTVNCAMRRVVCHANGGDGFHFTGNGTSGSFSACWGTDNGGYGWYVNDCNYYSWNGCGADGNANGWYFTDCESVAINGCGAEANTTDAFTVDASLSVEINGLWLYGNNHYGVHLTSTAYRVRISGVTESSPGGSAVASIITDAGSIATLENNTLITATALNGTATVLGDGTLSMPGGASVSGLTATGAVGGYTQAGRFTGFTFGGAPSGGTFATRDWALDAVNDCLWICTAGGTPGTWVSAGLVAGNNLSDVASRQISLNNLAGAVTSGDYLRGNGANVAMSAIQASDVPQLADYAPTGLTGATAASRYVGATASGAPASGTFAVGDFVIDRTGVFWVCTTAGSPGTWTGAAALALPLTGGTMSGVIAMGSHKITGLTNGSSAQDAAAYGQTPAGGNTVTVPEGGTGGTAMTAYAVLAGGTGATSPLQQVSGLGSSSQVLTSNGVSALPTWQAATGFANPMTTLGDIIYENAAPAPARLAGGTTSTKNFLTQTGTGTTSTAPAWGTIAAGDVPTLNQNTSGNAATATNLAGGATFPDYVAPKVVTLIDGTAVALNAALGNSFAWALGGTAHTLSAPSSPVDGQAIKVRIKYGGSYTPLFNSVFDFGTAGAPSWTATSGKTDIAGFEYDAALNSGVGEWAYLGSVLGLKS